MLKHILPMIPPHRVYVEMFCGGAAVFFAKRPAEVEVINDTSDNLITFYRMLKTRPDELNLMIQGTLHAESDHRKAKYIWKNPKEYDDMARAWALWVRVTMAYGSIEHGGYAVNAGKAPKKTSDYKNRVLRAIPRIEGAFIQSRDAVSLSLSYDTEESFYYVDPPYFNSDCGDYGGYSQGDFENLLEYLSKLKGKFLLSSYPSEPLAKAVEKYGWKYKEIKQTLAVDGRRKEKRTKTECLTWNYNYSGQPQTLFT